MKTWIKDITNLVGKEVELYGWIDNRRDHGKLIFVDLRDRSGLCQVVFLPSLGDEIYQKAGNLRNEWVVKISGIVNQRPEKMINANIATGTVEVQATDVEILNEALTPPFAVGDDGYQVGEDIRMKYRYIDLRRERLKKNIINRHKLIKFIRDYLSEREFVEIETPILTKSTPEGARDYVVPSRFYPGKFFALPQSPQQYKQILMASGFERYFQIARCFRDEDTRGDRQPEFTQLDMEMSFVNEEDIMSLVESMLVEAVKNNYPQKKLQEVPFPRITYKEAMEKYGTDRPDLRRDKNDSSLLAFCWVIDFPFFEKTEDKNWTFTHNPFSSPKSEHMEKLMKKEDIENILTTQYDIVLNGFEVGGGSIRNHNPEALKKVFEIMGFSEEKIKNNFGHMLDALSYGAPPHGGIAPGIDRLMMILENEPNIREVIAFPKTGDAKDFMMDAPSQLDKKQLDELGIEIKKIKEK